MRAPAHTGLCLCCLLPLSRLELRLGSDLQPPAQMTCAFRTTPAHGWGTWPAKERCQRSRSHLVDWLVPKTGFAKCAELCGRASTDGPRPRGTGPAPQQEKQVPTQRAP